MANNIIGNNNVGEVGNMVMDNGGLHTKLNIIITHTCTWLTRLNIIFIRYSVIRKIPDSQYHCIKTHERSC